MLPAFSVLPVSRITCGHIPISVTALPRYTPLVQMASDARVVLVPTGRGAKSPTLSRSRPSCWSVKLCPTLLTDKTARMHSSLLPNPSTGPISSDDVKRRPFSCIKLPKTYFCTPPVKNIINYNESPPNDRTPKTLQAHPNARVPVTVEVQ